LTNWSNDHTDHPSFSNSLSFPERVAMTMQTIRPATINPRAPMAAAPLVYNDDQSVAWDRMWDSFCVLASAGGPPHRATMLHAETEADPSSPGYRDAVAEIVRGIRLVSGLNAESAVTGWIAVECDQPAKARWLSEQIIQENVDSFQRGSQFFVPVGERFALKGEVKNVITAVAKTTHYWNDHLAAETKSALEWENRLDVAWQRIRTWLRRS
jgi:sirohydrochlorin cobaltochelatase